MAALGKAVYRMGSWIRGTGQALDRLGSRLQGQYAYQESLSKHRTLMELFEKTPDIAKNAFIAPSAAVIGDVKVGPASSIWYGCVVRGDVNSITIGSGTNIQDNTLVHVAKTNISGNVMPTTIGSRVTIGHNAVLHGCTIEDDAFVGMGATLLDGVHVEKHAMVGAGSLVKQNTRIPSGEVWAGNPAKLLRKLTEEEKAFFIKSAEDYMKLAETHAEENSKTFHEIEADKVRRKKWEQQNDDYDSHIGVFREKAPAHVAMRDPTLV
ncbi:hypothetical protein KP509_34G005500 [Ceratopteris richardii]|uniref:Uncharacterized protein n=1 Tax=Ceratopteris richardii TaxID=49495 RepID=A0A8T2QGZ2_CERRI|nr:hypothetical protein KP509_34G005500 [Ceratopteris richardii]